MCTHAIIGWAHLPFLLGVDFSRSFPTTITHASISKWILSWCSIYNHLRQHREICCEPASEQWILEHDDNHSRKMYQLIVIFVLSLLYLTFTSNFEIFE